jgi:hypothetical protein
MAKGKWTLPDRQTHTEREREREREQDIIVLVDKMEMYIAVIYLR